MLHASVELELPWVKWPSREWRRGWFFAEFNPHRFSVGFTLRWDQSPGFAVYVGPIELGLSRE